MLIDYFLYRLSKLKKTNQKREDKTVVYAYRYSIPRITFCKTIKTTELIWRFKSHIISRLDNVSVQLLFLLKNLDLSMKIIQGLLSSMMRR